MEPKSFKVGDVVKMKKPHPCGSYEWEILRTGMDFGIKCRGCGHFVMLARPKFEKAVKAIMTIKAVWRHTVFLFHSEFTNAKAGKYRHAQKNS